MENVFWIIASLTLVIAAIVGMVFFWTGVIGLVNWIYDQTHE